MFEAESGLKLVELVAVREALGKAFETQILDPALTDAEGEWLDDSCLKRYLKATNNVIDNCVQRLISTLIWRREFRPDLITKSNIEEQALTGKVFLRGSDREGRPIIYLVPARENSTDYEGQLRHVVFNLERAIKNMPEGVDSLIIIVDYDGVQLFNGPPLHVSKSFLNIISENYPERLSISFIVNPSWYLWVFYRLLKPFVDEQTASKIHFVDTKADEKQKQNSKDTSGSGGFVGSILQYISPEQLLLKYGGTDNWEYNFEQYWASLT